MPSAGKVSNAPASSLCPGCLVLFPLARLFDSSNRRPPLVPDPDSQVDEAIRNIQGQMKELSRLHRKRLLVSFDEKAEAGKEQEILALTEAITEQFRVVERKLTAVGGQMEGESDAEVPAGGGREKDIGGSCPIGTSVSPLLSSFPPSSTPPCTGQSTSQSPTIHGLQDATALTCVPVSAKRLPEKAPGAEGGGDGRG